MTDEPHDPHLDAFLDTVQADDPARVARLRQMFAERHALPYQAMLDLCREHMIRDLDSLRLILDRRSHSQRKRIALAEDAALNTDQEALVQNWARDLRLWTTLDSTEHNLRVFARTILKERTR